MTVVPEGFELAEVSAAKNIVYDAVYSELDNQGFDMEDLDLIDVAESVVEELLEAGIFIPASIKDPHGVR